ncbi:MFS transporter [Cytobacillus sp. Hm23]
MSKLRISLGVLTCFVGFIYMSGLFGQVESEVITWGLLIALLGGLSIFFELQDDKTKRLYEVLNKGEAWWGYNNSGYYLGAIIGGILIYKLSTRVQGNLTIFMISGACLFGMLTFTYGLITNAYLALLLVVLMGPAYQMRDMAQVTMTQNSADERTLTKVMAAKSTLIQFISIVSMLGISLFTDWIGVKYVYIFAGILLISSALYGFIHLYILKKGVVLEKELEQSL